MNSLLYCATIGLLMLAVGLVRGQDRGASPAFSVNNGPVQPAKVKANPEPEIVITTTVGKNRPDPAELERIIRLIKGMAPTDNDGNAIFGGMLRGGAFAPGGFGGGGFQGGGPIYIQPGGKGKSPERK